MGLLSDRYSEAISKSKNASDFQKTRTPYAYSTGIDILDHMNGKYVNVRDGKPYYSLGIDEGTYVMFIGKSGSGKTSLAIKIACNIIKDYDEGMLYLEDVEAATDVVRIHQLSGMSYDEIEAKVVHRQNGINCESFFENIDTIYRQKLLLEKEMYDEFMIHTGVLDSNGNEIVNMPPTVVLLDSLALLMPKGISEEEKLSGQMSTTAAARQNAAVFRRIIPKLKRANIILFVINHITTKIEINPMVHTKAAINYLKTDESVTGGNVPLYLANNIFKIEAGTKLKKDELYCMDGFTTIITMIKSRSNKAGQTCELIFNQVKGIDNLLSNLHYLKSNKILKGAGTGLYLEECPDVKFRLGKFKEKYKESKDLRLAFKKIIRDEYRTFINKVADSPSSSKESSNDDGEEEEKKVVRKKRTVKKK